MPQWLKADFFSFLMHALISKGLVFITSKSGTSNFSKSGASSSKDSRELFSAKNWLNILLFSVALFTTFSFSTIGGMLECLNFYAVQLQVENYYKTASPLRELNNW